MWATWATWAYVCACVHGGMETWVLFMVTKCGSVVRVSEEPQLLWQSLRHTSMGLLSGAWPVSSRVEYKNTAKHKKNWSGKTKPGRMACLVIHSKYFVQINDGEILPRGLF